MRAFLIAVILFIVTNAGAQISFNVNAGVNIGNFITKINGDRDKSIKPSVGYIIPFYVNYHFSADVFLQTGVEYESIHNKVNTVYYHESPTETIIERFNGKTHLEYINIPLKLYLCMYKRRLRIGAGPYLGIAVSGRNKSTDVYESATGTYYYVYDYNEKQKFGSKDDEVKRISFGLGCNIGYIFTNRISVTIYTNTGFSNISNHSNTKTNVASVGLTVGYHFKEYFSKKLPEKL